MTEHRADDDSTDQLIQSATGGEPAALHALLTRFLPELRAFVRLNMGPHLVAREAPEDIEQSVCREILQDLNLFSDRGDAAFKQWLFVNALRKIRDRAKYHGRQRRAPLHERGLPEDGDPVTGYASLLTPSHIAVQRERVAQLHTAFAHLAEDQRAVITMAKILGMSHAAIGEQLGRSPNSVAVLLHRALAKLGVMLAED